ncbi:hypothetical protein HZH68_005825 [Vespula germanica]|uniref:Uncharacterized protein n=1 Tax=Vespula germanica TaxID=30212 RepID=A0A834KLY6_VESGE|nr:hypothetical protein HZH68_005825 [Vespula germanica]
MDEERKKASLEVTGRKEEKEKEKEEKEEEEEEKEEGRKMGEVRMGGRRGNRGYDVSSATASIREKKIRTGEKVKSIDRSRFFNQVWTSRVATMIEYVLKLSENTI